MRRFLRFMSHGAVLFVLVGLAALRVSSGAADPGKTEDVPSPADDAKAAPSSHHFSGIWYRTPEKRGVLAAWLASGDLTVSRDAIVFESTKLNLTIPAASVSHVFDAPLLNSGGIEWIVVEYDEGGTKKAAAFRDGRMFKGDTGAVHDALFRSALSARAASTIAGLHTNRVESLYYTNASVPANVSVLAGAPDLEDALLRAYASGDPDDLFRFNLIMILNRRAVGVKDKDTRQRMHDCMLEALRTDSFGWVKVEALDVLRRLGDEAAALAQADVLLKSDKDAAIHEDVAKWLGGLTTRSTPAGVAAGLEPARATATPSAAGRGATPPSDDFFSSVCVEANTAKARADGHQERAEVMAGLICQIGTNDWGSHGCRENPDQDHCKRTLGVLDADLKTSGSSMLFAAAHAGRTDICAVMIAAGSDPSAAISTSWTPLMIAAAENKPETVKLLLAKGANPNARNSLGRTPVMFAANYGYTEIVEMLAKAGADLNTKATDKEGKSALIAAASKGQAGAVAALLRLGAHAEAVDAAGLTALMHASLDGNVEVMRALLDGGADINASVLLGTPLAMAGEEGHVDAVKLLLERGVDVNRSYRSAQTGLEGITPLMIAANEGQAEVVRLLVAAGADLNARNSGGATALDLATIAGKEEVVEILRSAAKGRP